jgi:hypothetical protein
MAYRSEAFRHNSGMKAWWECQAVRFASQSRQVAESKSKGEGEDEDCELHGPSLELISLSQASE